MDSRTDESEAITLCIHNTYVGLRVVASFNITGMEKLVSAHFERPSTAARRATDASYRRHESGVSYGSETTRSTGSQAAAVALSGWRRRYERCELPSIFHDTTRYRKSINNVAKM